MFIRMGRKAGHIIDFGSDDDFFAHNLDFLGTIHELPSQTAFCLIAGKYDGTILTPQVVFQMMEHTARVSHAAGRNDDHWAWHVIDGPRFFRCFSIMDVGHVDEASPLFLIDGPCLFIILIRIEEHDLGCFNGHRAINHNGNSWKLTA